MQSTASLAALDTLTDEERATLLTTESLLSLLDVFATIPDPPSRHGRRYDLPYLLTCLATAFLCGCDSMDAVGQWCREHRLRCSGAPVTPQLPLPDAPSLPIRAVPSVSSAAVSPKPDNVRALLPDQ